MVRTTCSQPPQYSNLRRAIPKNRAFFPLDFNRQNGGIIYPKYLLRLCWRPPRPTFTGGFEFTRRSSRTFMIEYGMPPFSSLPAASLKQIALISSWSRYTASPMRETDLQPLRLAESSAVAVRNPLLPGSSKLIGAEGSAVMWTFRVIVALLRLEAQVPYWPDAEERETIAGAFAVDYNVIGGCVGIIDGFHVVLYRRPGRPDGADFFNRKGSYSFNILGLCDHQRRIRHLTVGNVGCAGDNPTWAGTHHYLHPEQSFTAGEYLIADSAFTPSENVVPMFPRLPGDHELRS